MNQQTAGLEKNTIVWNDRRQTKTNDKQRPLTYNNQPKQRPTTNKDQRKATTNDKQ